MLSYFFSPSLFSSFFGYTKQGKLSKFLYLWGILHPPEYFEFTSLISTIIIANAVSAMIGPNMIFNSLPVLLSKFLYHTRTHRHPLWSTSTFYFRASREKLNLHSSRQQDTQLIKKRVNKYNSNYFTSLIYICCNFKAF